ncbi:MAG: hypothetical protein DRP58_02915 [Spirochaetes bacterium]|nr:MAG: hypothetical protein DRP58_02915 [Spirochaetota bacterium]
MKTTFELPDNLFKQAKVYAAIHSLSLKELFRQAISEKLSTVETNIPQKPWMEFYGKGKKLKDELKKLDSIIESEFEIVDPREWK